MGKFESLGTYFICFTIVLLPDSPAPEIGRKLSIVELLKNDK